MTTARHDSATDTPTSWPFGLDPHYCNAVKRDGTGDRCRLRAGHGTDHAGSGTCRRHGGSTPNGRKAAQTLAARTAVATYGLPRDVQPHQALMEELHRTAGHVAWLGAIIADMEAEEMHGPVGGGPDSYPREEPHVWLRLYQDERSHLTRVAKTCADVGVEERLIRQVESLGASVALVLKEFCRRMGLPLDDPSTKEAVVGSLRLIEPGEGT